MRRKNSHFLLMSFYISTLLDQVFVSKHLKGRSKVRKNYIPRWGTKQWFPKRNFFSDGKNIFPEGKNSWEKSIFLVEEINYFSREKRFIGQEKIDFQGEKKLIIWEKLFDFPREKKDFPKNKKIWSKNKQRRRKILSKNLTAPNLIWAQRTLGEMRPKTADFLM